MAFELPDHLPRGGIPQDISTQILTKLGSTTQKTLNANLVASWLAELDFAIQETKNRISNRINNELPTFEQQLQTSSSIQTRLAQLTDNANGLVDSLNNTETGILPTLLQALTTHGALASEAHDSEVTNRSVAHLRLIQEEIQKLSMQIMDGDLPESASTSVIVQKLISEAPTPLNRSLAMSEIQKKYRTLKDRLQERLNDAYDRSIHLRHTTDMTALTILSWTTAMPSSTKLTLSSILPSLSADSLSSRLAMLHRDIISKIVEPVLLSSSSIAVSTSESSSELKLYSNPTSPTPLNTLQILIDFLSSHLFPHLPSSQQNFPSTLYVPITNAILTHLLKPNLPSSIATLPPFLDMVQAAVLFEEGLISSQSNSRPIRYWANDVAAHYGKKRREAFFQKARMLIESPEVESIFRVEIPVPPPVHNNSHGDETSAGDFDDGTLSEDEVKESIRSPPVETLVKSSSGILDEQQLEADEQEDAWGWGDDDEDVEPSQEIEGPTESMDSNASATDPLNKSSLDAEDNAHKEEEEREEDPWDDDGWSVDPDPPQQQHESEPEPKVKVVSTPSPTTTHTPKMAKRLEKFSAKAKGSSVPSSPVPSQPTPTSPPPPSSSKLTLSSSHTPVHAENVPKVPTILNSKETKKVERQEKKQSYAVSMRARKVLDIALEALHEGQDLLHSSIFASFSPERAADPGELLLTVVPAILDLYRALYPIVHSATLVADANLTMRWSNDCTFLSKEITNLKHGKGPADDKWIETADRLRALSEVTFEDAIAIEQEIVRNILATTEGFKDISNAEHWKKCNSAFSQILREITNISRQWKDTLTCDGYFRALGLVVDEALFRIMDDIFSLQDIPEADSERLSDLCESLIPLEDLFVDAPGEQSVVGRHVPLWFKFSYLSWLIKGSIADISYLFDEGMLVDYEIDELIKLLRALFAETPLRENTIAKFSQGHPVIDDFGR